MGSPKTMRQQNQQRPLIEEKKGLGVGLKSFFLVIFVIEILYNILYSTGWVTFEKGSTFDTIAITLACFLPAIGIVFLQILDD